MSVKRLSQEERLLRLLENSWTATLQLSDSVHRQDWVCLPSIMALGIASHTKIISNLRAGGHNIECEKKFVDGVMHVRYRLVRSEAVRA